MTFSIITSAYQQRDYIEKTRKAIFEQTFKDYQWVIADDGSTDGLKEWVESGEAEIPGHDFAYARHDLNIGYRYGQIINKAVEKATGDYLVWINADSYPKEDFLEQLLKTLRPERLVNGVRMNVDREGMVTSSDWRLSYWDNGEDEQRIVLPDPWRAMTLNSMSMSRELFNKIGGMCDEYVGYGKEDYDLVMRAFFDGAELWWASRAILYTEDHPPKEENPKNTEIFERRKALFDPSTKQAEKMKLIMDPSRAQMKMNQQIHHMHELERAQRKEDL